MPQPFAQPFAQPMCGAKKQEPLDANDLHRAAIGLQQRKPVMAHFAGPMIGVAAELRFNRIAAAVVENEQ